MTSCGKIRQLCCRFFGKKLKPKRKTGFVLLEPNDMDFEQHNEMSYSDRWPGQVLFSCLRPCKNKSEGMTPFANLRKVTNNMPDFMANKFYQFGKQLRQNENLFLRFRPKMSVVILGIRYHRNYTSKKYFNKNYHVINWEDAFGTNDLDECKEICEKRGYKTEWNLENGYLSTYYVRPAFIQHPETAEIIFFNEALAG